MKKMLEKIPIRLAAVQSEEMVKIQPVVTIAKRFDLQKSREAELPEKIRQMRRRR